jgi:predicted dehydrogenase
VVVGYILRHHPSWMKFVDIAREMGKPLVMRMNLNQQSHGQMWNVHRNLMKSLSPIVDCGVHYIDVMCQMTRSKPVPGQCHRGPPHGGHPGRQLQLRPVADSLRGRFGGLVRSRLGTDDERNGFFREGRDRAERVRFHRG